jgi:selenocysteine lyase/cysteine desulfurase
MVSAVFSAMATSLVAATVGLSGRRWARACRRRTQSGSGWSGVKHLVGWREVETIASVAAQAHYLRADEGAFEDGTLDYLNIPAVTVGLRHIDQVGLDTIHRRVACLTGWLLDALDGLRHQSGRRLVQIYGPRTVDGRGGTIALSVRDRDGLPVDDLRVEELANRANISVRTGCFCNPGAGEAAYRLGNEQMGRWFGRAEPVSYLEFRARIGIDLGRIPSAIRVSVGVATNFADVYRFVCFLARFFDRSVAEIDRVEFAAGFRPGVGHGQNPAPREEGG